MPPGLTRGSGAAEGGHLSLSLPYLPSSAAKGWLWARSAARQARAGEGRGRGVPPAAPSTTAGGGVATGPRAICLLLLPQGRWPSQPAALAAEGERRDRVRSESTVSTSAGQSQAPDGSFSLQGPTLTRGNCCPDPSVIIRPQTSLIHYDVPCTPVIQTLMVGRGQPVESRLKQSRPEACPGASGPSPRAAPSRQAQLCHQSAVCQPGARGPRNATFQPPGV